VVDERATNRAEDEGPELFSPVETGRMSGAIVDQVRDLIYQGKLRPGRRLPSERELAERFGVSRVTVRDALRSLETMGLVEIRVGAAGGAFLTAPSSQIVGEGIRNMLMTGNISPEQVAEVRLIIELGIVRLAVARATEDDLRTLKNVCDRSQRALDRDAYDVALSTEFHAALAQAAHNPAVEIVVSLFRGPLSMHNVRAKEEPDVSHKLSVDEHVRLTAAIVARDLPEAHRVMTEHLLRKTSIDASIFPVE
jgi:GntR family transcriptional repressor for pyruvate dehydrogenase complex